MDESAIWQKFALTAVQIAHGFASCNSSVAVQYFSKSHSPPYDYLYQLPGETAVASCVEVDDKLFAVFDGSVCTE